MTTLLSVCTSEEQRAVVRFLWAEGLSGAEIHRRLSAVYGSNSLTRGRVYEWIEKFKNGRTSVSDEERSGRPLSSATDSNVT